MYIVINSTDDRICAEWNYITEKQKHICWKTPQEIEFDNSYKNDTTHMKKFETKKAALEFIRTNCKNDSSYFTISTNPIQRAIDNFLEYLSGQHTKEKTIHHL